MRSGCRRVRRRLEVRQDYNVAGDRLVTERQLKRMAVRVTKPSGGETTVIPDGLATQSARPAGKAPLRFRLEVIRLPRIRSGQKVEALASWAAGPATRRPLRSTTTVVVVAPSKGRVDTATWKPRELEERGYAQLSPSSSFLTATPPTAADLERGSSRRIPGAATCSDGFSSRRHAEKEVAAPGPPPLQPQHPHRLQCSPPRGKRSCHAGWLRGILPSSPNKTKTPTPSSSRHPQRQGEKGCRPQEKGGEISNCSFSIDGKMSPTNKRPHCVDGVAC